MKYSTLLLSRPSSFGDDFCGQNQRSVVPIVILYVQNLKLFGEDTEIKNYHTIKTIRCICDGKDFKKHLSHHFAGSYVLRDKDERHSAVDDMLRVIVELGCGEHSGDYSIVKYLLWEGRRFFKRERSNFISTSNYSWRTWTW